MVTCASDQPGINLGSHDSLLKSIYFAGVAHTTQENILPTRLPVYYFIMPGCNSGTAGCIWQAMWEGGAELLCPIQAHQPRSLNPALQGFLEAL